MPKKNGIFNTVPFSVKPTVNRFNLSQEVLTTAEIGKIYPIFSEIFVPNTYHKINLASVIKTQPMFAPIYSGIEVNFAAFAIPMRLLWSKFFDWAFEVEDTEHHMPFISEEDLWTIMSAGGHTLANDFDIPTIQNDRGYLVKDQYAAARSVTIQDFLAYHLIWQEYFRSEHIEPESFINQDSSIEDYSYWLANVDLSGDTFTSDPYEYFTKHRNCEYHKDYFTSALPSTQMGVQTFLNVLSQTTAPVNFVPDDRVAQWSSWMPPATWYVNQNGDKVVPHVNPPHQDITDPNNTHYDVAGSPAVQTSAVSVSAYADLAGVANGLTPGDFRTLFAGQAYLEQLMLGGGRYPEGALTFYGARVNDFRAQRPEFIGLNTMYISPQEVVAHDAGDLGQLGAYGQAIGSGRSFRYFCTEHTIIMVLMYMRPKSLYMQGLPKKFRLNDQLDFPLQIFQHIGEEPVKNEELFYTASEDDDLTFGYQNRYAYWRSSRDRIRGDFAGSLTSWHLGRIFHKAPQLNEEFLQVYGDMSQIVAPGDRLNRVFNYSGKTDHFLVDIYLKIDAKLPLKYHSKPMLIG